MTAPDSRHSDRPPKRHEGAQACPPPCDDMPSGALLWAVPAALIALTFAAAAALGAAWAWFHS